MTQKQQQKDILLARTRLASLALEWIWQDDSRRTETVINDIISKENE